MKEDKIIIILQELDKVRQALKEIKKDLKREEKIDDEQYETMRQTVKEMRAQIKDFETDWKAELHKDSDYQKLVEMKVEKEEEAANLIAEMYHIINSVPDSSHLLVIDGNFIEICTHVLPFGFP